MLVVRYIDNKSIMHEQKDVRRIFLREINGIPHLYIESVQDEEGKGTEVRLRGGTSWDAVERISGGSTGLKF